MKFDGRSPEERDAFVDGLVQETLPAEPYEGREHALLDYADRLTRDPASVTEDDIAALRDVGLDDRAIHDAAAIIGYYAFVNRLADGLGVELETGE